MSTNQLFSNFKYGEIRIIGGQHLPETKRGAEIFHNYCCWVRLIPSTQWKTGGTRGGKVKYDLSSEIDLKIQPCKMVCNKSEWRPTRKTAQLFEGLVVEEHAKLLKTSLRQLRREILEAVEKLLHESLPKKE